MIIGQIGIGLALKTLSKSINLGWIIASTLLLDILLWIFILFGIESYSIPSNYEQIHHFNYDFPYSHGFLAALCWTLLVYFFVRIYTLRQKRAVLLSMGIFFSILIDIVTHPAEIPFLVPNSFKMGFGLSNHIYVDFVFELLILLAGLYLYFKTSYSKTFLGRYGLGIFMVVLIYVDFGQLYLSPDPTDYIDTALSSLTSLVAIIAIVFWLDKQRSHRGPVFKSPQSGSSVSEAEN